MGYSLSKNFRRGDGKTSTEGVVYEIDFPPTARSIAAILYQEGHNPDIILSDLQEISGKILAVSETNSFSNSNYYESEMGVSLKKFYIVFDNLISPREIISIKQRTSLLESLHLEKKAGKSGRIFNIDPGYFTHAQLVLATHKNYSHRIFLGGGVFAELTYLIQGKSWITLPWTYPDYKLATTRDFFIKYRNKFVKETKAIRPIPGTRVPMWKEMSNLDKNNIKQ